MTALFEPGSRAVTRARGRTRRGVPWLAALLGCALLWGAPARGADYDVFIDVETEDDLLDLLESREISEETYETLVELLHDGVDLNDASRGELYSLPNLNYADVDAILAYRKEAGAIADPAALVAAEVISHEKLAAISSFLVVSEAVRLPFNTSGRLRYRTTWVAGPQIPSMWLGTDIATLEALDVGAYAVLTRSRLGEVVHDANDWRDALSARDPSLQVHFPKYYLEWETDDWHVVGGTYRIGFGQRATFDNTGGYEPNGIKIDRTLRFNQDLSRDCKESAGELADGPCTGEARYSYISPDYGWTDRLRGVAAGLKELELGPGWAQAYAFASYQTRSIYQYEIYDRRVCADPLDDEDPACKAPSVYRWQEDPLAPTTRFSYYTLPNLYNELVVGSNAAYFFHRRAHVGLTAYGADIHWLVDGMELDFQEWARTPYGGPFGAIGIDAAFGYSWIDLFAEVTRSVDSQPEGGGFAGIMRSTATFKDHEIEAALRYYETSFANPFGRAISEADEYDGLRARDETGLRLRYSGKLADFQFRTTADLWLQPSEMVPKTLLKQRVDYRVLRWLTPGLWIGYTDKDLGETDRRNCYEAPFEEIEGESVSCKGERTVIGGQLKISPLQELAMTAKYQHELLDDGNDRFANGFRQDASAYFTVGYRPFDFLRLRARARYLYEDITDNSYLENSLRLYFEGAYWYERLFQIKMRYEVYAWFDVRDSTLQRDPSPAHWLRLELEYRF